MHVVIDRFEDGGRAVLEALDGASFSIPRDWLPARVVEGDVLTVRVVPTGGEGEGEGAGGSTAAGGTRIEIAHDPAATRQRREDARALRSRLPKADGGDIAL